MKYAIISDIHGNLTALRQVLGHIESVGVDRFVCLGDIVGYGPEPAECMEEVKRLGAITIMGNHDAAVCGLMDLEWFNEAAREAALWHRGHLPESMLSELAQLPYTWELDSLVTLTHGSFNKPQDFEYVLTTADARRSFDCLQRPVGLLGHSHIAVVFIKELVGDALENPRNISSYLPDAGHRLVIEQQKRYLINPGSVGQPRDGDPRAAYAIYDDAEHSFTFYRVEYDIADTQRRIIDQGLPYVLAARLSVGR